MLRLWSGRPPALGQCARLCSTSGGGGGGGGKRPAVCTATPGTSTPKRAVRPWTSPLGRPAALPFKLVGSARRRPVEQHESARIRMAASANLRSGAPFEPVRGRSGGERGPNAESLRTRITLDVSRRSDVSLSEQIRGQMHTKTEQVAPTLGSTNPLLPPDDPAVLKFSALQQSELKAMEMRYALGMHDALVRAHRAPYSTSGDVYPGGRPSWDRLQHIVIRLTETTPLFFTQQLDYTFYRDDLIFENRIFNISTQGLRSYWYHCATLSLIRLLMAAIEMKVVSIVPVQEDAIVRLRWRAVYLPLYKMHVLRGCGQDRDKVNARLESAGSWFDGVSTFYVDAGGMVVRHVAERVQRDPGTQSARRSYNPFNRLLRRLLGTAKV